ncbi:MAG: Polyphenol oxidase [Candidatus Marinimicrobia bacterium]|nr:Polyphenol oxidase [Candidatus Neomarinimicrobiota bacterium]
MIVQQHDNLEWAQFREWESESRLFHAFTTRNGGVSEGNMRSLNLGRSEHDSDENVDENRRRFFTATGVPRDETVMARQVHSNRVTIGHEPGVIPNCDGFITGVDDLYLIIGVADCHTIFLTTSDQKVVGALHAGWRGIAGNILGKAIDSLEKNFHYRANEVEIGISPGIGECCYEVGAEVVSRFPHSVVSKRGESYHLNLAKTIEMQAHQLGIPGEQIYAANCCTSCEPEYWYSYRRDDGVTGRMWGVIGMSGDRS